MATLGGYTLGTVSEETSDRTANLTPTATTFGASNETNVFDFGGVTRVITITGFFNGTIAANKTAYNNIEALQNGLQTGTAAYANDVSETFNVKIDRISKTWTGGKTRILVYTITMIEADSTV